jgi:DnaK suppressor protein
MVAHNELYTKLESQMRQRFQSLVEEVREDFVRSTNHEGADWDEAVKDEGDLSVADVMADLNLQRMDQRGAEIRELAAALQKMIEGTYGECEECGEKIDPRRLEVQPISRWCITCANRRERATRLH